MMMEIRRWHFFNLGDVADLNGVWLLVERSPQGPSNREEEGFKMCVAV